MTIDNIYLHVMVAAASCMLITGLLLALVKSPSDGRASKFRAAKYALTVSVLVLGSLNLVQLSFDSSGSVSFLGPCIALAVGYLQSMLFTMALLVLIRPEEVTFRVVIIQLVVILVAASLLVGAFFLLPRATFLYVYELGIVAYLLQLAFYIHWFRRSRRVFLNHIRQYYEEDEIERSMWWVYIIFWAALAVGLLSLLMMFTASGVGCGLFTIWVAHTTFCVSYVAMTVLARLQDFDDRITEAAYDLGAGPFYTFFVTGPGADTLPLKIYSMIKHSKQMPVINSLSTLMLAFTCVLVAASRFMANRRNRHCVPAQK